MAKSRLRLRISGIITYSSRNTLRQQRRCPELCLVPAINSISLDALTVSSFPATLPLTIGTP
jgi:hypothetical protein